ncbi:MAG TPA: cardiolipin synthase [Polyangiaceae bacterium]|nr:cardiolipin synthase [Polyangiaceae bacterium]
MPLVSSYGWLSTWLLAVNLLIIITLVPRIVAQRRESAATLAWVLFILLVPLGGALAYHLLGTRRLRKRVRKRVKARARFAPVAGRVDGALRAFAFDPSTHEVDDPDDNAMAGRIFAVDRSTATAGNDVLLLPEGPQAFEALERAIGEAKHHVHALFYIFRPDETGRALLALLAERARAGVEVRLLVDAVGSFELRPSDTRALRDAGGKVAEFLPVSVLAKPFSVNFRNHRKVVVVDGRVAFTGGMNVGDEYRGRRTAQGGPWRDLLLRLRGPAALRLQEIFVDDWNYATDEGCFDPVYFPPPERPGRVVVQVVSSGPDSSHEAIYHSFFSAITGARQRVWLTTPYFIPDVAIFVALVTAALRGVDVRLLLPGSSDHPLVLYAGQSYYEELLAAGVRVFEFNRGFLHAKTMVVDHAWTALGSANMDMRSFRLNWEANVVAYDADLARSIALAFVRDCEGAVEVKRPLVRSRWRRTREAGSYLLSPLL